MIRRIELTNFMSHRHTVLEPAPGLTVLVGPNNCGKSAVVTALRILAHNESSKFALRHGEKECSVRVETDDGHVIEWSRRDSPRYVIDGKIYDRLGVSGVPEELQQVLRLLSVEASSDEFDVHFGEQKSPIFLLDKSPSNAAAFFASSSDVIHLVEMQNVHRKRMTERKDDKKRLEARSKRLNAELEQLQPMTDVDARLSALEALYNQLENLTLQIRQIEHHARAWTERRADVQQNDLRTAALSRLKPPPVQVSTAPLERLLQDLTSAERDVAAHEARSRAMAELAVPPVLPPVDELAAQIEALLETSGAVFDASARKSVLQPLTAPPELADVRQVEKAIASLVAASQEVARRERVRESLQNLADMPAFAPTGNLVSALAALQQAQVALASAERHQRVLTGLSPLPALADVTGLEEWVQTLATADAEVTRHARTSTALASLANVPPPHDCVPLSVLLDRLRLARTSVEKSDADVRNMDDDLQNAVADVRAWAAANPVCPTCGGAVQVETLVGQGGHRHGS